MSDGKGCNNVIGATEYFTLKNIEPDYPENFVSAASIVCNDKKKIIITEPTEQNLEKQEKFESEYDCKID